jgi:hypothetical protein
MGLVAENATRFDLRWFDNTGLEQRSPLVALTTGQAQIVTVVKAGAAASTFRNGVSVGTVAVPIGVTPVVGKLALGERLSAQVAEILVYNRALSAAERTQIESALSERYSIPVGSVPDTDGDGLSDAQEDALGTNKFQADHPDVQLVVTAPTKRIANP